MPLAGSTTKAAPPYSCTVVRTLKPLSMPGMTSCMLPSGCLQTRVHTHARVRRTRGLAKQADMMVAVQQLAKS